MSIIARGIPRETQWFQSNGLLKGKESLETNLSVGDPFPNFALFDQHDTYKEIRHFVNQPVLFVFLPNIPPKAMELLQMVEKWKQVKTVCLAPGDNIYTPSEYLPIEFLTSLSTVVLHGDGNRDIQGNLAQRDGSERSYPAYLLSKGDQVIKGLLPYLSVDSEQEITRLLA